MTGDAAGMVAAAEEAVEKGYRHIRNKIGLDPALDCHAALRCASASATTSCYARTPTAA